MEEIKMGLSMEQLSYLEPLIKKEMEDNQFYGASLCVVKEGNVQYRNNYGIADKSRNIESSYDTIYRLYSMTKPVTVVAAMILYERGQLDLLAPVSNYLPSFGDVKVYSQSGMLEPKRPMLVKDLINMTSGLIFPDKDPVGVLINLLYSRIQGDIDSGKEISTLDFCNMMAERPLAFHPGESWRYGASIDVLGGVIEVASGKKLSEFMKEAIFNPLGMVDTDFHVPRHKHNRLAELYKRVEDGGKYILKPDLERDLCLTKGLTPPSFESGGAGLFSTMNDYMAFVMMLANKGTYSNIRILGRKTLEMFTTNAKCETITTSAHEHEFKKDHVIGCGYSGGMRILLNPTKAMSNASIGEFGWDSVTGSYFSVDADEKFGFIFLTQTIRYYAPEFIRKMRAIINSSIL